MGFYNRHILPRIIDAGCGMEVVSEQRKKIVPQAQGRVVEIGMGSCMNLPFYDAKKVSHITGVEPDPHVWARGEDYRTASDIPLERMDLSGEDLPIDDKSADTVVVTYALCTIPDPVKALGEMKRILKPGGRILFAEHGMSPDPKVQKWQHRIDPIWKRLAGGCHTSRNIPALIQQAGLKTDWLEQDYLPGPKAMTYNYWGAAS